MSESTRVAKSASVLVFCCRLSENMGVVSTKTAIIRSTVTWGNYVTR